MKKMIVWSLALAVCLAPAVWAKASSNQLSGKPALGTFTALDKIADDSQTTFAVSGRVNEAPQFLTIDLQSPMYLGSVSIYWAADALSHNYSIRVSSDRKNWFTEFSGLDASEGILDEAAGTRSQVVSLKRYTIPVRYLQVYVPSGSSGNVPQVKIAEMQVTQAENLTFSLLDTAPYAVSDKKAIIVYRTSIGAIGGQVEYGTDQANLGQVASNLESGVINSVTLTGLTPRATYYYKVKTWDAAGRVLESQINYIRPAMVNLALNRPVSGTFVNFPPNDTLVNQQGDALARVTDGSTSYFAGMATSGSLLTADQRVVIDLGANRKISSIVSYWRALAYPESFRVLVSEDNNRWTEVSSKQNAGEGAFARSDTGDPMRVVNSTLKDINARYIELLIDKGSPFFAKHAEWDFVQLMEVEVF
jgi:hypothetical protein